jgi:hypothetical protein
VTANDPLTNGNPEMTPLDGSTVNTFGNGAALNVAGLMVALMV